MPKPSRGAEASAGAGRIRKRGCSSSSSSSSLLHHCRLKRAVLVAKRAVASTPAPAWKTEAGSTSSASEITAAAPPRWQQQRQAAAGSSGGSKEKNQGPVSARKLASALWELHGAPAPSAQGGRRWNKESGVGIEREYGGKLPSCLSDPSHSPSSEVADRSGSGLHRRRASPLASQRSRLSGYHNNSSSLDSLSNGSCSMEIEKRSRSAAPVSSSFGKTQQNRLKDLKNGLYASKELVKTLNRFVQIDDHHQSSSSSSLAPIISALHDELDRARLRANYLSETSCEYLNIATHLRQKFREDRMLYKEKLQQKVHDAIQSSREEFAVERKLRRRADRLNEKLMMELTETKARLARATEELEDERRRREVIEQVCDELVKGIGDDRAEMEKMKEESEKVREELEREREMLQLADVWREERVQMKLSEAKYHLEEKNAAVDQLRHELETYLMKKRSKGGVLTPYENGKVDKEIATEADENGECNNKKSAGEVEEIGNAENAAGAGSVVDDGELDSEDSDLHSIELSVDNINRSYRWNFTAATIVDDEDDQLQQEEAELSPLSASRLAYQQEQLEAPGCSRWSFDGRGLEGLDLDMIIRQEEDDYSNDNSNGKFNDQDVERYYKSVKVLRDQMLLSCKMAPAGGSPTKKWVQPRRSLDCDEEESCT